ncbi:MULTISPECIES: NfeD family protein [Kamptonema]|uniref:NfeD family protein n=1 Tax=Kamptonema TaxID=1501433 RepID=UPI0001DAC716|nr:MULTISPECIES: NfeD family protein [Kamptonema]CBN57385.1 hypothetical protein OSCI_3410036 [Kamptonema sp. PCC 6506]
MFNLANLFRIKTTGTSFSCQKVVNHDFNEEAIVDEPIYARRTGRVYFQSSWWPARCDQEITLETGDIVYVIGIDNITLLVTPAPFL